LGLYQPLFDRRLELISGASAPTPAEIAAGEEVSKKDDPEYTPLPPAEANAAPVGAGIPEFWLTALRNHLGINELITERDGAALKSLVDIKVSYDVGDKGTGFVLMFEFAPNEFFEEKVLTKTYVYKVRC
jgi:nucleosome assembly protein 1-like 1